MESARPRPLIRTSYRGQGFLMRCVSALALSRKLRTPCATRAHPPTALRSVGCSRCPTSALALSRKLRTPCATRARPPPALRSVGSSHSLSSALALARKLRTPCAQRARPPTALRSVGLYYETNFTSLLDVFQTETRLVGRLCQKHAMKPRPAGGNKI